MIRIPYNNILVEADGAIVEHDGVGVSNAYDQTVTISSWGTVTQVPDLVRCFWKDINSDPKSQKAKDLRDITLKYDFPIKLKVGDRVMVKYNYISSDEADGYVSINGKKNFIVPYDDCYGKMIGSHFEALNGFVFIEPTLIDLGADMDYDRSKIYASNKGTIRYLGDDVKGIVDRDYSPIDLKVGEVVFHTRKRAPRTESFVFRELGKDMDVPLLRVHRSDIFVKE